MHTYYYQGYYFKQEANYKNLALLTMPNLSSTLISPWSKPDQPLEQENKIFFNPSCVHCNYQQSYVPLPQTWCNEAILTTMDQYEDNVFYHLIWKILINFNQSIEGLETTIYMIETKRLSEVNKLTKSTIRQLSS